MLEAGKGVEFDAKILDVFLSYLKPQIGFTSEFRTPENMTHNGQQLDKLRGVLSVCRRVIRKENIHSNLQVVKDVKPINVAKPFMFDNIKLGGPILSRLWLNNKPRLLEVNTEDYFDYFLNTYEGDVRYVVYVFYKEYLNGIYYQINENKSVVFEELSIQFGEGVSENEDTNIWELRDKFVLLNQDNSQTACDLFVISKYCL